MLPGKFIMSKNKYAKVPLLIFILFTKEFYIQTFIKFKMLQFQRAQNIILNINKRHRYNFILINTYIYIYIYIGNLQCLLFLRFGMDSFMLQVENI